MSAPADEFLCLSKPHGIRQISIYNRTVMENRQTYRINNTIREVLPHALRDADHRRLHVLPRGEVLPHRLDVLREVDGGDVVPGVRDVLRDVWERRRLAGCA